MNDDQIIKTQLENSAPEIQQLLSIGAWKRSVTNIAKANSLSEEQATELENEVLFVLLGMDLIANFAKNIQQSCNLPSTVAGGIAIEITQKVFEPLRQFLPTTMEDDTTQPVAPIEVSKPKTLSEEILAATEPVVTTPAPKPNLQTPELVTPKSEIAKPQPLPENFPKNTALEEKIAENVQSEDPTTPRVMVAQYKGNDPYREPIQ